MRRDTPAARATLQLCTYNRAHLLGRVLDACFEQTVASDAYEVVLVDDGSSDETAHVIAAAARRATCAFTVVAQANAGLARARNAGIARARGERIIFIDDDVLPIPAFVAEHLRSHARSPGAIVRGAVVNTESFERLPTPLWTFKNYSGNFFWTSNVSVPLQTLRDVACLYGRVSRIRLGRYRARFASALRGRSRGIQPLCARFSLQAAPGTRRRARDAAPSARAGAYGRAVAGAASALARRPRDGRRSAAAFLAPLAASARHDGAARAHRATGPRPQARER